MNRRPSTAGLRGEMASFLHMLNRILNEHRMQHIKSYRLTILCELVRRKASCGVPCMVKRVRLESHTFRLFADASARASSAHVTWNFDVHTSLRIEEAVGAHVILDRVW
ncbi:unnamed protein product [Leptosia nina]|uniref:Uncharacterized protein n=1 Tax=Leptosia nina TaxID=320188 RepID=A0AAV1JFL9_9NEOP